MKNLFNLFLLFCFTIVPLKLLAGETIIGHYCYTYGDNESLIEARELVRTLAIRNAIESYRVFIQSTTNVKNFKLTSDIIQIITSGYLKNVKVIEHSEKGRTICETIQASIEPKALKNIIKREIKRRTKKIEEMGIDNNGYLKILNIKKLNNSKIRVTVKVLKRTGSLYFSSDRNKKPYFRICIDFYDSEGNPFEGNCSFIHTSSVEMIPGQITAVYFSIPSETVSYRVWLPKVK